MRYNGGEVEAWVYDREEGNWLFFGPDCRVLSTFEIVEVKDLLSRAEAESKAGNYAAGFVSYEAAPAFDTSLRVCNPGFLPLAWFLVGLPERRKVGPDFPICEVLPALSEGQYQEFISRIKNLIAAGDTYQVNFTFPLRGRLDPSQASRACPLSGSPAAFLTDEFSIYSASPELFFSKNQDEIVCRPMKGTRPRGVDREQDLHLQADLASSAKDQAENLMIVDMIRNDLGRIAETGTVEATALFEIETYPTVLQMTSTVRAKSQASLAEIFCALFPCSSITGAPKRRTMEIIADLENRTRGVYTGAIGWISPGGRAQFNVGIRTAVVDEQAQTLEYSVGSGVVWDSDPKCEWDECLTKSLALRTTRADYSLIETVRWERGSGYRWRHQHAERIKYSADQLEYPRVDECELTLDEAENYCIAQGWQVAKVRLELTHEGVWYWEATEIDSNPVQFGPHDLGKPLLVQLAVSASPNRGRNAFLKTSDRSHFDGVFIQRGDNDEVILWNREGQVTEACNWSIAAQIDGVWYTPSLECGLLPGVERAELLLAGLIFDRIISVEDFRSAQRIALFNSVRGWRNCTLSSTTR